MKIKALKSKLAVRDRNVVSLFCTQVSGPDSKRKAVEAGLLKTVIDLLETPEPVQVL